MPKVKKAISPSYDHTLIAPKAGKLPDAPNLEDMEQHHRIKHLSDEDDHTKQFQKLISLLIVAAMAITAGTVIGLAYFDKDQPDTSTYLASETGAVTAYDGEVEISYNNGISWQMMEGFPQINPGVHLRTQEDASLSFGFGSGSSIELAEQSEVGIDSLNNIKVTAHHVRGDITVTISESEGWTFELLNNLEQSITGTGNFSSRYAENQWQLDVTSGWLKHNGSRTTDGFRIDADSTEG